MLTLITLLNYVSTLTFIHVAISLVGIATGFVFLFGLLTGKHLSGWTAWFLGTTLATSLSGFLFPFQKFTPAIGFGIISLIVLGAAIPALYVYHLAGAWRTIYIIGSLVALYLNVFVAIVQAFQKIPFLNALAPTGAEGPFLVTQLIVLLLFIALSIFSTRTFRVAQA